MRLHVIQCTVLLSQFCLCLSVCPSICLSITHVDCDKTKQWTADILIPHEMAITLVFRQRTLVGGRCPLPCQIFAKSDATRFKKRRLRLISALNVSTIRDSEKSSIMTNRKSTTGFPTSYIWSEYVAPKSRKGGSKRDFFVYFE